MKQVDPIKDIAKLRTMKELMFDAAKHREALLLVVGANAGLRISDLLKLTWKDVRGDSFTVKEQKTGKTRKVVINAAMREARERADQGQHDDELVFRSSSNSAKDGAAWSRNYVWETLKHFAELAGVPGNIGTHTLRKTFGYHLYKNGTPLEYIQRLLNHSSPVITLRYIGIEQEYLDNACMDLALGF